MIDRMYTMSETCEILQVSYRTLHRLVSSNSISSVKVGRSIRIPQAALRKFILEGTTGGNS